MTDKYWLFYSHRGYADHDVFRTEKEAREAIDEDMRAFGFPILIKGVKLKIKDE
ncbi:MAG: hypothetical protein U9O78_04020 [Patescibacteria group bacterium]|nr:hypothetical protein [Patescibacteria group bacterium]